MSTEPTADISNGRNAEIKDRFGFRSQIDLTYARTPQTDLTASIYFPFDWRAGDKRSAILFFFGGGFRVGTRHQFVRQATYLASRGMVAVTADYRVMGYHNTSIVECFEDAFTAFNWLRSSSDEFGIDPERIAVGGGSAGGALAFGTAVLPGLGFDGARPGALVLFNPAIGLRRIAAGEDGKPAAEAEQRRSALGLTDESLSEVSMEEHITSGLPPTFAWFGTDDRLLIPAEKVFQTARSLGCTIHLQLAEGADHGYFNDFHPFFESSIRGVDEFLGSIGYIEGPPLV